MVIWAEDEEEKDGCAVASGRVELGMKIVQRRRMTTSWERARDGGEREGSYHNNWPL